MGRSTVWRSVGSALTLSVALAGLVACGGDDDDSDSKPDSLSGGFSVAGALAQLPTAGVDLDAAMIQVADLDAASTAGGVERPTDGSREAFADWVNPITGVEPNPVFVPIGEGFNFQAASPDDFAEVAGWSINDASTFAEISAPPYRFTVVTGIDDNALADSLIDSGDGIRSSSEGDDLAQDLANVSAVDRLGRAIRFQQRDDMIGFGTSTEMVKAWADGGETLADNPSYAGVAAALDDEDVVSAVLTAAPTGGLLTALGGRASAEQLEAVEEQYGDQIPQEPFDVVGIGWDDDGEIHIAYHFADEGAADASADVLEKAWTEGTLLQTMAPISERVTFEEIDTEDSVVVVTVEPVDQRASVVWSMLNAREGVFISN